MKFKNKKLIYVIAFLIPIILVTLVLFTKGIGFNAEKLLVSDMHTQYTTLFSYLRDVLLGKESIFYSFNNGLGGSMYAAFAYYLASPLNLLVILFKENSIPQFVMVLLFIKIGLCGLTMNIYVQKHFMLKKESLIFSTCYALMAYVINYYFNIMWLDGVFMLPLVLLGLDKLLKENKSGLYVITLFIAIFSNFYIGYMICIFSVIYFIQELIINYKKEEYKNKIIRFVKYSLIGGLLASFLLIPVFFEIQNFSRSNSSILSDDIIKNTLQLFSNFYVGAHHCNNLINGTGTFLFCSIFCILNSFLYFFNKNINRKEKIISIIILLLLLLSSILLPLKYMWHGFSYTNFFNNRFSFIISFYLIFIAIKNFMKLDCFKINKLFIFILIYNLIGIIVVLQNYNFFNINNLIMSDLFVFLYLVLGYLCRRKKTFGIIIFMFVLFELFLNTYISFNYNKSNAITFKDFKTTFCTQTNKLDDDYRIDETYIYGGLDSLLCNYSGITSVISTNSKQKYNIISNLGYTYSKIAFVNTLTNTPIADSLLGVKYGINFIDNKLEYTGLNFDISFFDNQTKENVIKNFKLYKNNYALKLGYLVDSIDVPKTNNSFEYQNELIKEISGINKDALIKIKNDKITDENYKIYSNGLNKIYIKINHNALDNFAGFTDVYVDNKKIVTYKNSSNFYDNSSIFYYNNTDEKKSVFLKINNNVLINDLPIKIKSIDTYYFDESVFKEQIEHLKINEIYNVNKNKNKMSFNIDVLDDNRILLLTIPYEKGWNIYDNGVKIEYSEAIESFIYLNLNKGIHKVQMIYKPKSFLLGIFISTTTFIIYLFDFIKKKCKVGIK